MADARLTFAATVVTAALAVLALIAIRPAPAFAQEQQNQASGATPMSGPGSGMDGRGFHHVDIPQPPLITMTAVPGYGPAPLTVGFFVNTVDPEGKGFVSYVWNFGDGQVSMDPPLTFFHTYQAAGSYVATVNATTADGRVAVGYVGITVRPGILN
ncbi:MAG TPA: PKD domain-containing protein [Candidatus Binataceae bacterium]|nr:PKD domain-containing protein [Candidatus Binataceae bacterium]